MTKKYSYFIPDKENPVSAKEDFIRLFHSVGFGVFVLVFGSFLMDAFLYARNGAFFYSFGYAVILALYALGWYFCLLSGRIISVFFIIFNFCMFCVFKEYYKVNIDRLLFYDIISAAKEGVRAGISNSKSLTDTPFYVMLVYSLLSAAWVCKHQFLSLKKIFIGFLASAVLIPIGIFFDIFYWLELSLFLYPNLYVSYNNGLLYKITYSAEAFFSNPLENLNPVVLNGNAAQVRQFETDDVYLSRLPRHIYLIQAESLTAQAITPRIMPFLSRVEKMAFYTDKKHYHCLGSANTDFMMMSGLNLNCEKNHLIVFFGYQPDIYQKIKTLPARFKEKGYQTRFSHSFEQTFFNRIRHYPFMGFDTHIFMENFPNEWERGEWGVQDKQMLPFIARNTPPHEKTFDFIITANTHPPFIADSNLPLPFPKPKTPQEGYLNTLFELDTGLKDFYEALKEDSLVLLYGDHNLPEVDYYDTPFIILYKGEKAPQIIGVKEEGFIGTIHFINSLFENKKEALHD